MEGVVVEVRVRAPCKRFAIKDNGICDRSARGFDGHKAKLHSFFSLRTIRVVTRTSANLSRIPSGLPTIRELGGRARNFLTCCPHKSGMNIVGHGSYSYS